MKISKLVGMIILECVDVFVRGVGLSDVVLLLEENFNLM